MFYRRSEREMPAFKSEYDRSKVEGVRFHWLAQPMEIIGFEGRAAAVRFVETRLGAPDHSGRSAVIPVPGSHYEFACDMVIPAIGQARLTALLENTRGIAVKNGLVVVDRPTGRPPTRATLPEATASTAGVKWLTRSLTANAPPSPWRPIGGPPWLISLPISPAFDAPIPFGWPPARRPTAAIR